MLEDQSREIFEKVRSLRESLPDERATVTDEEEQRANEFARELDFVLVELKSRTLARIEDAVVRLERGSYGTCVDCEQPIAALRLEALPFAERCRECQEDYENIAAEATQPRTSIGLGSTVERAYVPQVAAARGPGYRASQTRLGPSVIRGGPSVNSRQSCDGTTPFQVPPVSVPRGRTVVLGPPIGTPANS